MHKSGVVYGAQAISHRGDDSKGFDGGEDALGVHAIPQRRSIDVLHAVVVVLTVDARRVDLHDVGVVYFRKGHHFTVKALRETAGLFALDVLNFDGDLSLVFEVCRVVHDAHTAMSERALDGVTPIKDGPRFKVKNAGFSAANVAPQGGPDFGQQDGRLEGLDDVVVGAAIESLQHGLFVALGRYENDGDVDRPAVFSQLLAGLDAGHFGHRHVHEDQVWEGFVDGLHDLPPVLYQFAFVLAEGKGVQDHLANSRIVIRNQDHRT